MISRPSTDDLKPLQLEDGLAHGERRDQYEQRDGRPAEKSDPRGRGLDIPVGSMGQASQPTSYDAAQRDHREDEHELDPPSGAGHNRYHELSALAPATTFFSIAFSTNFNKTGKTNIQASAAITKTSNRSKRPSAVLTSI